MKSQSTSSSGMTASGVREGTTNASASVKKSTGSFFEKHAFAGSGTGAGTSTGHASQPNFLHGSSNVVQKMPSSSSSYNMHRQNATRTDSNANPPSLNSSGIPQQMMAANSRDKPSAKQFSQNMLSKSQQFASMQFNQQMLSQQSYLAQGNFQGQGVGAPPQMQQQNFIGAGLVNQPSTNLNTSSSQHSNGQVVHNSSSDQTQLSSQQTGSPKKRYGSKTSLGNRKQNSSSTTAGAAAYSDIPQQQNQKVIKMQPQSSIAQKRYSVSNASSGNGQGIGGGSSTSSHQQMLNNQAALQKQGGASAANLAKSESNNKLRRISNMKQTGEKSSSDRRNKGLIISNNQSAAAASGGNVTSGQVSAGQQPYTQSQNPNLRFMQQMSAGQNTTTTVSGGGPQAQHPSTNMKSSTTHMGGPNNMSNLTSFQQLHSDRTSMTDDPHSALMSMQWQMRDGQNNHVQCSTERYTNDQKVRFMQQLHSSNEVLGLSQTSQTYPVNAANPAGILAKKKANEKLFFVTDHKLYEDSNNRIVSNDHRSESSGLEGNNNSMQKIQHPFMYDIEMENVYVKQVEDGSSQGTSGPTGHSSVSKHVVAHGSGSKMYKKGGGTQQVLIGSSQSNLDQAAMDHHTRGAAAAPVNKGTTPKLQHHQSQSIVCPIYQSKDFRLMTGQQSSTTTKNRGSIGQHVFNSNPDSKSDNKDVKRGSGERKESNKGNSTTAARRSMSDDMHEDVYMAKSDHAKAGRKRPFKAASVIEQANPHVSASHNNSLNSSSAYERSHFKQMKKNAATNSTKQINTGSGVGSGQQQSQWAGQDDKFNRSNGHGGHYSETNNNSQNQMERSDAEPLAEKLLYLTNQACTSKVKSKSHLTQSMKSQGLRKGIKSPSGGSQSTLQEPSAKAMPTSSKVKISQKFNKFEQSNPAMRIPSHPAKQNLFQTKTLKKQGSGPINDFKEFHKSPEMRHTGAIKKNGSISYAILPRHVIPSSDLKAHKKMKSPSPGIKNGAAINQDHPGQNMRSPNTTKQSQQNFNSSHHGGKNNQSVIDSMTSTKDRVNMSGSQQQLFEARRLSQQRGSNLTQKPPNVNSNKSQLIESVASHHRQQPQSVTNSIGGSKRISFTDLNGNPNKVLSNEGADEAKKLYCMVDSRKNSQSSLQGVLSQVQILQVDSHGNNKGSGGALNKVQLKTKDKLQNYMKPAGFLSQSPKAKKHSATSKQSNSIVQQQSSMLMTHGSTTHNSSTSKLQSQMSGKQQKFVQQMQAAYSSVNHHMQSQMLKSSASGAIGSISNANKALLQIQAPKVVHLQSPPSRILVKASPRVSPNPKIRKQGIQTCKVSIDTLQKNSGSAHQKVNRASSKEFLKTIKLVKRGSNSPSPSSVLHSSKNNGRSPAHHHQQALANSRITHNDSSTAQIKNYNQNQKERQSSQNSNSTLIRQTSQNTKLFSRLQLRRAKDVQAQSTINNQEIGSFSERQSQDFKGQSTASLLNPSVLSNQQQQLAQQIIDQQYTSLPEGTTSSQMSLNFKSGQQNPSSLAVSKQNSKTAAAKGAKGDAARGGATTASAALHLYKDKGRSSKERQMAGVAVGPGPTADSDEKGAMTIEKQAKVTTSAVDVIGGVGAVAKKQKPQRQMLQQPQQTPTSPIKKSNNYPSQDMAATDTRQAVKQSIVAKSEVALTQSQMKDRTVSNQGGLSIFSNDEMREQAQFVKDIEKLKKMIRMHFRKYNSAPPTTCEFYRIGRVLGKGAFGKVSLAMHKLAEQLVAIKSMSKETLQCEVDQRRRTKLEMGILAQCNHPNVVRLFDTFETSKHICFVIELCSGGDLFSYIKKRRRLKEDVARFFFKQLVEGLAYIHNAKKVVHRDIKLENILLDATGNVKICDFGVSRQLKTGMEKMKEQCGTPAYIAPEILLDKGYIGFNVDMWSAGVCLYAMLIGSVPFKASTMDKLQNLIIQGQYDFKFQTNANSKQLNNPKAATTLLSEEVQDLISRLLQTDPEKRLTAVETLQHPWLQNGDPNLDVYTDKEKQLIQREYMRLNLKLGQGNHRLLSASAAKLGNSRRMTPNHSQMHQETEQDMFTEHNLETRMGDEEPQLANQEEKSFILAPFNSVKSMFIDQGNQIKEVKKDDPPYQWPRDVIELIAPRRTIKFSTKCREKNRIYEQNNNADLDNGVYNEFVNEQEREEGALMNNAQEEGKDDCSDGGSDNESPGKRKHLVSENSIMFSPDSVDSLEKSFKETELASDDEEAERQITKAKDDRRDKKEEAFDLLQNSIEEDKDGIDMATPEERKEQPTSKKQSNPTTPILSKSKSKSALRHLSQQQLAATVPEREYLEPEFVIDSDIVANISDKNVIPHTNLMQELAALRGSQTNARDKNNRLTYVTAYYFLLVKRKELVELQRRQDGLDSLPQTPLRVDERTAEGTQ